MLLIVGTKVDVTLAMRTAYSYVVWKKSREAKSSAHLCFVCFISRGMFGISFALAAEENRYGEEVQVYWK